MPFESITLPEEHMYSHTRDKTFQCECCKRDMTPDGSPVVILCPGSYGDLVEINKDKQDESQTELRNQRAPYDQREDRYENHWLVSGQQCV